MKGEEIDGDVVAKEPDLGVERGRELQGMGTEESVDDLDSGVSRRTRKRSHSRDPLSPKTGLPKRDDKSFAGLVSHSELLPVLLGSK